MENPPVIVVEGPRIVVEGLVAKRLTLTPNDLATFPESAQVADVSRWDPGRAGRGVTLAGLLDAAGAGDEAAWMTLHASRDDFHASIPLAAVRDRSCVIYQRNGQPLAAEQGGPFRFLIRDYAACKTDEIDDCANVKYVDRIELTAERGEDNRPRDEAEHRALHERQ